MSAAGAYYNIHTRQQTHITVTVHVFLNMYGALIIPYFMRAIYHWKDYVTTQCRWFWVEFTTSLTLARLLWYEATFPLQ